MDYPQPKTIIRKLLQPGAYKISMYASWLALCIGFFLLFIAVLAWFDFRELLSGKERQDSMASFVVIGKKITDQHSASFPATHFFNKEEIAELEITEGVQKVGPLTSNRFPVSASLGGNLGFYTELFLESVNDSFLDSRPEEWIWQPGSPTLPVILSNDFLNLYNYGFALSQGYPQLSQAAIKALPFQINIEGGKEKYRAQIVGFTDRISSLLVPQNFMEEMNKKYSNIAEARPSRLILQVKDPSNQQFIQLLKSKNYTTNEELLRWNRIRTAVQAIVTSVGMLALIVVGISVLSFLLFMEITIRRASGPIKLMMQLGYSPITLRKKLHRFFMPWLSTAACAAAISAFGAHLLFILWLRKLDLQLTIAEAWVLPLLLTGLLCLLFLILHYSVRNIFSKVG